MISEKVTRLIAGLFIGLFIARYLGPGNFGIINYAVSFTALFAVIANLGLDEIIVKELLKNPERRDEILGTSFRLKLFGVLITFFLVATTFIFEINDSQTNFYIAIITFSSIFQPLFVIDFYFQSQVQAKYLVKANIICVIVTSIIRLVLVLIKAPLVDFVLVSILDALIVGAALIYFYSKKQLSIFDWKFDCLLVKSLLSKSFPLIFSSIVIIIYMRIDQIMLKEMIGFEAVGIYSASVRISELWYFIPVVIGSSIFPALINAKNKNELLYLNRFQGLLNIMIIISVSISVIVSIFSNQIINLLYGVKYSGASIILSIHVWTGVFVFIGVASSKYLIIENLYKITFYRTFFGAVINVILNLFLIRKFGGVGAAVSTLIAQMIAAYFYDIFNKKTRQLFFMKTKALFFIGVGKNLKKVFNEN